jgi:hypothetical protein
LRNEDVEWERFLRDRPASAKRITGVRPTGWSEFITPLLAELGLAVDAHPDSLLKALELPCEFDNEDWALSAYHRVAVAVLMRLARPLDKAAVEGVMRELILPQSVARSIAPTDLARANPYVDLGFLRQIYATQRGGSGAFPAIL